MWAVHLTTVTCIYDYRVVMLRNCVHKLSHNEITISKEKDIRASLGDPHFPLTKTNHHDLISTTSKAGAKYRVSLCTEHKATETKPQVFSSASFASVMPIHIL